MAWHDEYDYWESIARIWGEPVPIVNVEHDNEYSDELARLLVECPHPRCAYAYRMYPCGREWQPYWAFSPDGLCGMGHWGAEGDEWAAWSAIGFCKIAPVARGPLPARCGWRLVEQEVNYALRGHAHMIRGLWHIHWPAIEHYHYD